MVQKGPILDNIDFDARSWILPELSISNSHKIHLCCIRKQYNAFGMAFNLFETHKMSQTNHSLIYLPEMSRLITNDTFYYVRKVKIKQHFNVVWARVF